jgi:hypothetical protein
MRKIIVTIAGVVVVLVLACIVYLGFISFEIAVSQSASEAFEEDIPVNLELGQLVNGEILRLGKNFELRYPKDWALTKLPLLSFNQTGEKLSERWRLIKEPGKANSLKIDFEVSFKKETEDDDFLKCPAKESLDCQEVTINGTDYQKITTRQKDKISKISFVTFFDNNIYQIVAYPSADPSDLQDLETVFSTFRFLK